MADRRDIEAASKGNPSLRLVLDRFAQWQAAMEAATGIHPLRAQQPQSDITAAPPLVTLDVEGGDGNFIITIENPTGVDIPLLHHLQSSETVPFETSSTVIDYGVSTQLSHVVNDPKKTYYWRVRSRYPNGQFNGWQLSDAVDSATLSGDSLPNIALPQQAQGGITDIIQLDATLTIIVGASTKQIGPSAVAYNSGSLVAEDYDTYYIYAIDTDRNGGDVTYIATLDPAEVFAQDGAVFFGKITLYSGGGGQGVYEI